MTTCPPHWSIVNQACYSAHEESRRKKIILFIISNIYLKINVYISRITGLGFVKKTFKLTMQNFIPLLCYFLLLKNI